MNIKSVGFPCCFEHFLSTLFKSTRHKISWVIVISTLIRPCKPRKTSYYYSDWSLEADHMKQDQGLIGREGANWVAIIEVIPRKVPVVNVQFVWHCTCLRVKYNCTELLPCDNNGFWCNYLLWFIRHKVNMSKQKRKTFPRAEIYKFKNTKVKKKQESIFLKLLTKLNDEPMPMKQSKSLCIYLFANHIYMVAHYMESDSELHTTIQ